MHEKRILKSELRQTWRVAHSRSGGEALQRGEVWWLEFSSHYQLGTTEELVKTILSDVIHCVLRKMNGDGPQERRGDLTVERLERKKKRVNKKKEKRCLRCFLWDSSAITINSNETTINILWQYRAIKWVWLSQIIWNYSKSIFIADILLQGFSDWSLWKIWVIFTN